MDHENCGPPPTKETKAKGGVLENRATSTIWSGGEKGVNIGGEQENQRTKEKKEKKKEIRKSTITYANPRSGNGTAHWILAFSFQAPFCALHVNTSTRISKSNIIHQPKKKKKKKKKRTVAYREVANDLDQDFIRKWDLVFLPNIGHVGFPPGARSLSSSNVNGRANGETC